MTLIVDGKLAIPLYHGTSGLFYKSIQQFGLGGRNLIKELCVIELLRELITICQTRLPNQEEWLVRMQSAEWIAQQNVSRGRLNFRHGSVYLTPSSYAAANYATSSEHGSEALSHFMMLWNRIRESRIDLSSELIQSARPIMDFAAKPTTPIMIRLHGIPVRALASEIGSDAMSVIQRLEEFKDDQDSFYAICQRDNFELLEPINIRSGDVFQIVQHERYQVKEPTLAPYRCARTPADCQE